MLSEEQNVRDNLPEGRQCGSESSDGLAPDSSVNRDDFLALLSYLSGILKTHAGIQLTSHEIWRRFVDARAAPPILSADDDVLQALKVPTEHLRKFAAILVVLRFLASELDTKLEDGAEKVDAAALHHDINDLPDAVLALIMDYATVGTENTDKTGGPAIDYAWDLLQVCSRFRTVMLSTPTIWAKIEVASRLPPRHINAILEYSRGLPLTACLTPGFEVYPPETEAAKMILQHGERFEELHITRAFDPPNIMEIYDQFKGIRLPNLHSLTLNLVSHSLFFSHFLIRVDDFEPHIYKSWSMPQLKNLITDVIPLPMLGKNLSKCVFNSARHIFAPKALLKFLASAPLLESLDIRLTNNRAPMEDSSTTSAIELRHLKDLVFRIEGNVSSSLVSGILDNLKLDNLSQLHITDLVISFSPEEDGARWEHAEYDARCEAMLRFILKHRLLRELFVFCEFSDNDYGHSGPDAFEFERFDRVLGDLPKSLDHLVLFSPVRIICVRWDTEQREGHTRPIHRLDLPFGEDLTIEYLRSIRDAICKGGPDPEAITIGHWPLVRENEVQDLFPASEIMSP